jgi:hypothetical protein
MSVQYREACRIAGLAGSQKRSSKPEVQSSNKGVNSKPGIVPWLIHVVRWFELWGLFELRILNFELPAHYVSCVFLASLCTLQCP